MCRYTNLNQTQSFKEIFGAHTDSSFITVVPVALVSGLEVYDEDAETWYRPELMARKHWEQQQQDSGEESSWHARYVVMMPGELLQLLTRNEVPATVHRVVAVHDGPSRISSPMLLRGRPGTKMDVARYLDKDDDPLLTECDGMTIEQIHDAMQPASFQ